MSKETRNTSDETMEKANPSDLGSKPQRRSGRSRFFLLLLVALGMLIVGGGLLLIWAAAPTPSTNGNSPSSAKTGGTSGHPPSSHSSQTNELFTYVTQHIAQALHVSVNQLTITLQNGMKAGDNEILQQSAQQQGISPAQLHTLEINTLAAGLQQMVTEGKISQQNADGQLTSYKNMDLPSLNVVVTKIYLASPH